MATRDRPLTKVPPLCSRAKDYFVPVLPRCSPLLARCSPVLPLSHLLLALCSLSAPSCSLLLPPAPSFEVTTLMVVRWAVSDFTSDIDLNDELPVKASLN